MIVLEGVWGLIQLILLWNLMMPIVFYVFYKIIAREDGKWHLIEPVMEADYAIIVTAYEDTSMLPAVVDSLLQLDYSNYLIYVVADNCDISSLKFSSEKVVLLRPETVLAGNVRSHFYAIDRFRRPHDRLTIIDSDNLVHRNYLSALDKYFSLGFEAVQGVRRAKNMNTLYASLDAARDLYYHFYDGKVLFSLGSSATLAGSGMAFTADLYKRVLADSDVKGAGFDKVLQYGIVGLNKRIAFTEEAIVFDEKTARTDQLVKQRARWINTWFKYAAFGGTLLKKAISYKHINPLLFGLVLLRPPLFIFLGLAMICLVINFLWGNWWMAGILIFGLISFIIAFFVALKEGHADKRIYLALKGIPKFVYYQLKALLYAKKANKVSVATKHNYHRADKNQD